MSEPRHVNDILQIIIPDLFERSRSQARADSIMAARRELPKLCAILDLDPATLKPKVNPTRNLTVRMATDKQSLMQRVV